MAPAPLARRARVCRRVVTGPIVTSGEGAAMVDSGRSSSAAQARSTCSRSAAGGRSGARRASRRGSMPRSKAVMISWS